MEPITVLISIVEGIISSIIYDATKNKKSVLKKIINSSLTKTSEYFSKEKGIEFKANNFKESMDTDSFIQDFLKAATSKVDSNQSIILIAQSFAKYGQLYFPTKNETEKVAIEIVNKFIIEFSNEMMGVPELYTVYLSKLILSLIEDMNTKSDNQTELLNKCIKFFEQVNNWNYSNENALLSNTSYLLKWTKYSKTKERELSCDELCGKNYYNQEITPLNTIFEAFINSNSWIDEVELRIKAIPTFKIPQEYSSIRVFLQKIEEVDLHDLYETVQNRFVEIYRQNPIYSYLDKLIGQFEKNEDRRNLHNYIQLKKSFQEIEMISIRSKFSKCFLLTGATGSGKTQFISSFFSKYHSTILPLYVSFKKYFNNFEQCLLQEISICLQTEINSLFEFQKVLKQDIFSEYKILIVIDDIEYYYHSDQVLSEMISFLRKTSNTLNLYWVLSINYNFIDCIDPYNKYLDKYKTESNFETTKQDGYFYNGWVNLDIFNKTENIGQRILIEQLSKNSNFDDIPKIVTEYLNEIPYSLTPFLAWLIYETGSEKESQLAFHFTYLEIIDKIKYYFREYYFSKSIKYELVDKCIHIISNIIYHKGDLVYERYALIKEINNQSTGISELEERDIAKHVINHLLFLNLLTKQNNDSQLGLNTIIYWQSEVAKQIIDKVSSNKFQEYRNELLKLLDNKYFAFIFEGIFEFIILKLDENREFLYKEEIILYYESILHCNGIPKAPFWYAAIKLSPQSQDVIKSLINNQEGDCFESRHDLFALINFIGNSSNKSYRQRERMSDIHSLHLHIANNKLFEIYSYTIEIIINNTKSINELFHCLPKLNGSETLIEAEFLAEYFMNKASDLYKDLKEINRRILVYLEKNCKKSKNKKVSNIDGVLIWKRYYLREWLLFSFAHRITNLMKLEAYSFFKSEGWYSAEQVLLERTLSLDLEREANIAIGGLYLNKNVEKIKFLKFLDSLIESTEDIDYCNCFHIIRHTVITRGSNKVLVDECFSPYLKLLFQDERLGNIRRYFKDFFHVNGIGLY